ncbi:hypothetical protein [Cohnella rhizosphaerae]|uniref:Uncharacterized protein n=1 Tax=Cohnella rhizosphaerae TaxID=1457232 RepID=A0A9X4L0S6_9BACL|nr:hypothetical protein [Cohnella rhizosphaerae]MDG0814457.1 hypothetical protein [Cohnella rhizosphaerae]
MRAILIDDERPALLQLQWLLDKEPDVEVCGAYQTAADGLAHLSREAVDLVFFGHGNAGHGGAWRPQRP